MANEFDSASIRRRLDCMILLLLEIAPRKAESTVSKIDYLLELGFSQSEVAQIIGKKINYVTATIAKRKKGRSGAKVKESSDAEPG